MTGVAYFVTTSRGKVAEAQIALLPLGIEVIQLDPGNLEEVLSLDLLLVSRQKALAAYNKYQVPLFCEHGALEIQALQGLPGSLSKVFFDRLGSLICSVIPAGATREATAKSVISYCDGRRVRQFSGLMHGEIAPSASGGRDYYYDTMFIPVGSRLTYAEMDPEEKVRMSHVQLAYEKFADFLRSPA